MGSSIQAMCTTGLPGWMIMALESVQTLRNATCSRMGSPFLTATTGATRATSTCGTPWVRRRTTADLVLAKPHNDISVVSPLIVPGQYYETCDGSSSSVTVNTSNIPLGAEIMEVMVYRKRERRKYSPLTVDNTVFYVTGRDTFDLFQPQNQENYRIFKLQKNGNKNH